jgi:hypothetical protein
VKRREVGEAWHLGQVELAHHLIQVPPSYRTLVVSFVLISLLYHQVCHDQTHLRRFLVHLLRHVVVQKLEMQVYPFVRLVYRHHGPAYRFLVLRFLYGVYQFWCQDVHHEDVAAYL